MSLILKSTVRVNVKCYGPGVATSRKVPGSIPGRVTGDFFPEVHVSGFDSASKNEW